MKKLKEYFFTDGIPLLVFLAMFAIAFWVEFSGIKHSGKTQANHKPVPCISKNK